jgi:uncharacterized protein YqjF (DUF2071 family)
MKARDDHGWIMRQSWHDLLFAHWRVSRDHLRELVPSFLEIDTIDGEAWVAVTPFHLTDVAPRGVPALPFISAFNEINVRTYVSYKGVPGVYFFSLDANSAVAVTGSRTVFHLPYFTATIEVAETSEGFTYHSSRTGDGNAAKFEARCAPEGPAFTAAPGSLEFFLTERYALYTTDSSHRAYRVDIDHDPWLLRAAAADISLNTMASAAGIRLAASAPLLHFAARQDVVNWAPLLLE